MSTVSRNESQAAASLRALFGRLVTRRVEDWTDSEQMENTAIPPEATMADANIVTSRFGNGQARHVVVLDIDRPAWLVRSSTPGHFHLYIDVPGGVPHETYMALLGTLADAGVVEYGYARASQARGFSSARFPWIKKESVT